MGLFKKLWNFLKNTVKTAVDVVRDFFEEIVENAPAATIMIAATVATAQWLKMLPLESIFLSVPVINEVMVASIGAVLIVLGLSTLAGRNYVQEGGM